MTSTRGYQLIKGHCPTCDCDTLVEVAWQHFPKSATLLATCQVCENTWGTYRHEYPDGNPNCGYKPRTAQ